MTFYIQTIATSFLIWKYWSKTYVFTEKIFYIYPFNFLTCLICIMKYRKFFVFTKASFILCFSFSILFILILYTSREIIKWALLTSNKWAIRIWIIYFLQSKTLSLFIFRSFWHFFKASYFYLVGFAFNLFTISFCKWFWVTLLIYFFN